MYDLQLDTRSRLTCNAVSIASLNVFNSRGKVLATVIPNTHPAGHIGVQKENGDEGLLEYVQVGILLLKTEDLC